MLKTVLLIGGQKGREQEQKMRGGIHIVVATPGRLVEMLNKKKFTLDFCKYDNHPKKTMLVFFSV